MRLADRLGMHLHELMGWPGPMTERQFRAWEAYLDDDLFAPSRADYYQMQTACTVAQANAKDPSAVRMDAFVLRRKPRVEVKAERQPWDPPGPLTKEQVSKVRMALLARNFSE